MNGCDTAQKPTYCRHCFEAGPGLGYVAGAWCNAKKGVLNARLAAIYRSRLSSRF